MPKLSPKLKKIRDTNFITAVMETGSIKEAAKRVGKIGSQGAKNPEHSAESMGSQRLQSLEMSMVDALLAQGVTPKKIAERTDDLLESQDPQFIDKGITQSMKMGLGGGYAAEKTINTNLNINSNPAEIDKFKKLREEYEKKVLEQ